MNMNSEVKMSVSSMTRNDDKKGVYVLFTDKDRTVEFIVPGCKVISNKGFNEDEIKQLRDYVDNEQDYIFSLAKTVNPMKAFMGERV